MIPAWINWAREIQALSQTSLHFSENAFQVERYNRLTEIAAEIIAAHTQSDVPELVQNFQAQRGYATPRVDVRAAVFRQGKLLLVREISDDGWTLPGGWADVGDTPSLAAEREVREEAGFAVKANKLVGVYDANRVGELTLFHAYKLVFLCDLNGGQARPSSETSAVGFYGRDEIPQPFSGERTQWRYIEDAFAAYADPDWVTVFD
ncbi:MAG: NUDIX hydrolase N-terminal domain-containing protein [Anaerolineae bacterium]|nr:NUDIX hydrolase N-terminal domain-containing protein [Anaerolineae bacterium]